MSILVIFRLVLITNITIFILSLMIKNINKLNLSKFEDSFYLIEEINRKIDEESVFENICYTESLNSKKFISALEGFFILETTRAIYIMDAITDKDFLELIDIDEEKVSIIQKNIKPYIKLERIRADIDTVFFVASVIHIITLAVYLIFSHSI